MKLRIATRKSALALWQTEHVAQRLRDAHPGISIELVPLSTRGDQILDRPLAQIGGKGLFLKELEVAMQHGEADLAVHSLKDVPMQLEAGFVLAAILEREDPADAFVSNHHADLGSLPIAAVVGTSSLRRQAQILAQRPDLQLRDLRGNVNTRLAKLDAGEYDAIVLAVAGLKRLGFAERVRARLQAPDFLPAASQGAIAIECLAERQDVLQAVAPLHDVDTDRAVRAERAFSRRLSGSCEVPLAAYATLDAEGLALDALVASPDGQDVLRDQLRGNDPEDLGLRLAERLIARGAQRLIGRGPA